MWESARELALDPERWAVPARCERGYTKQLPDLAVWLDASKPPGAVVAESGGRRERPPSRRRSSSRSHPPPPCQRITNHPTPNPFARRHPQHRPNQPSPGRHQRRRPRQPKPPPSASGATARPLVSTSRSPDADGAADPEPLYAPRRPASCWSTRTPPEAFQTDQGGFGWRSLPRSRCRPSARPKLFADPAFTSETSATKEGSCSSVRGRPRDQDRRLAPALATDLAALGEDHTAPPAGARDQGRPSPTSAPESLQRRGGKGPRVCAGAGTVADVRLARVTAKSVRTPYLRRAPPHWRWVRGPRAPAGIGARWWIPFRAHRLPDSAMTGSLLSASGPRQRPPISWKRS